MNPQNSDTASGITGSFFGVILGAFKFNFDDLHKIWIAFVIMFVTGTGAYFVPRFWRWLLRPKISKVSETKKDTEIGKD